MKKRFIFSLFCLCSVFSFAENEGIHVYDPVPDLAPSEMYSFRVRTVGSAEWLEPFAFITRGKAEGKYFDHLDGWSNTYINFEMSNSVPVEIEISKVGGAPITKAVAHPEHKVTSCDVIGGKAYVVIEDPALFTVDIDGQMDDQDTGKGYNGPPIHTLTVFANAFIQDRPSTNDTNVLLVEPGTVPSDTGSWDTLYFLPGVHDIGLAFPVHAYKNYYIPGDAVVHGSFNNGEDWGDGHDIRIFGHGTLSGERYPHPDDDPSPIGDNTLYSPIRIVGARDTTVEGITVADSAMHSIMLINSYQPDKPTDIRWVKIFTWRGNGDGINPFGNVLIEDCFIRTQDDSTYVNGLGMRRIVFWNDWNGSTFVLSAIANIANPLLVIEDCDVVYARAGWHKWSGGRLFNMRGEGSGAGGNNVVFRNIRVEDPRPTLQHFMIAMQGVEPWSDPIERQRGPGDLSGILFQDIEIAAPSVLGEPDLLWGMSSGWIRDLVFDNVTIAGEPITSIDHFHHNEFVTNLTFIVSNPVTNSYSAELFVDTFEDGNIDTATSTGDVNGGFNVVGNLSDPEIDVFETGGSAVLDLEGATNNFPYVSMMSKHAFNGAGENELSLSIEVARLMESWWYLRPFAINLRPNAITDAQIYNRGTIVPPLGLSLMVGNQDSANCRVALVAYDGTTENWLWEDLEVMHADLADGFTATITVNRTNGWQLAFTDAASLPASASGSWDTLGWTDIFNPTTYVQCYLREDSLSGSIPQRAGMAKAEITSIAVTGGSSISPYHAWAALWGDADLSDPLADYDNDTMSNLREFALNGNPTNPASRGVFGHRYEQDGSVFTFSYASNTVDDSLSYRLIDRTNLLEGAVFTNHWNSQTFGSADGDYISVSNHYNISTEDTLFIEMRIDQE